MSIAYNGLVLKGNRLQLFCLCVTGWFILICSGRSFAQSLTAVQVDAITAKVARLRGLTMKRKLDRSWVTKKQIRDRIVKRVQGEFGTARPAIESLAMKRIGLLPAKVDYTGTIVELRADQLAGFYDAWARKLFVASEKGGGQQAGARDIGVVHEIGRALQDQHFHLRKLLRKQKNNDARVATQALIEGDSVGMMLEYVGIEPWENYQILGVTSAAIRRYLEAGALGRVPLFLRERTLFSYLQGLKFVVHFRRHHPWKRVNKVYRRLPLSTEQVIHPRKYELYESPHRVVMRPIVALRDHERVYADVLGELGLSIFLRQHGVVDARAVQAAAGWGGDRFAVYTRRKGQLLGSVAILYFSFDHIADAMEAFEALSDALTAFSRPSQVNRDSRTIVFEGTIETCSLEHIRDRIVVVIGGSSGKNDAIRKQVWKRWRRVR